MPDGGGGTTVQSSAPWEPQQPYLKSGLQRAEDLYKQGGVQPAMAQQTTDALNMTEQRAREGSYLNNIAKSSVGGQAGNGMGQATLDTFAAGASPYQSALMQSHMGENPGASTYSGIQGTDYGSDDIAAMYRANAGGNYLNSNPVNSYLGSTASGAMLNSNPYIDATFEKAAQPVMRSFSEGVMPGIQGGFAKAGRYGSGAQANAEDTAIQQYGRTLGDLATGIYGQNYAQERQNQLSAAGTIGSAYSQERANQLGAIGGLSSRDLTGEGLRLSAAGAADSAWNAERGREMQGAQAAGNMAQGSAEQIYRQQLAAAGMLPGIAEQDYADAAKLGGVGTAYEQFLQQQQLAPYDQLARYQGAITGNYGGTALGKTQQPASNTWGNIAQGVVGAGLAAKGMGWI